MDNSKLVSPAPSFGSRATNPIASEGQSSYIATQPGTSPLEGQLMPSRMDVIRRSLADRGLSDDAINSVVSRCKDFATELSLTPQLLSEMMHDISNHLVRQNIQDLFLPTSRFHS